MASHDFADSTVAVSAGRPPRIPGGPLNAPITMASALIPGADSEYGRHGNPAWESFESVLGELEGGRALAFSSGTSATTAVFGLVAMGGTIVAPAHCYNGSMKQLTTRADSGQIQLRVVDISDTAAVIAAVPGASLIWIESPTNPALEIADIPAIVAAAHDAGALVAVDNTFATPLRQKPLEMGADIVVHSASKLLAGHSDVILGAVVTADVEAWTALESRRRVEGAIPGALECYLTTRGIRTLHVRLDRAEANAIEIHRRLQACDLVASSRYPGFSNIIGFEIAAGPDAAQRMTEQSQLITYATSLGGVETTWERRRRFAGEPTTIPEGLVRLSVGIEDVEDLWNDIINSIKAAS